MSPAQLATMPYNLVHAHLVTLPYTPIPGTAFWDCLNTKEHIHQAADQNYSKDQLIKLCSKPETIEKVPPGKKVHRALHAPHITNKGDDRRHLSICCSHVLLVGTDQVQGIDFDHSWSLTISVRPSSHPHTHGHLLSRPGQDQRRQLLPEHIN